MKEAIAIDGTGRLVIPKGIRQRFGLVAGVELTITEEDGRIVLTPSVSGPRMVERDGRLLLDPGGEGAAGPDHLRERDERLRDLIAYALQR